LFLFIHQLHCVRADSKLNLIPNWQTVSCYEIESGFPGIRKPVILNSQWNNKADKLITHIKRL